MCVCVLQHQWKYFNSVSEKAVSHVDFLSVLSKVEYVIIKASYGTGMQQSRSEHTPTHTHTHTRIHTHTHTRIHTQACTRDLPVCFCRIANITMETALDEIGRAHV